MIDIGSEVKIDPLHGIDTLGNFAVRGFTGIVIEELKIPEFPHWDILGVEWIVLPHISILAAHFRDHLVEL